MEITAKRFKAFDKERISYDTAERLLSYENVLVLEERFGAYQLEDINTGEVILVYVE